MKPQRFRQLVDELTALLQDAQTGSEPLVLVVRMEIRR